MFNAFRDNSLYENTLAMQKHTFSFHVCWILCDLQFIQFRLNAGITFILSHEQFNCWIFKQETFKDPKCENEEKLKKEKNWHRKRKSFTIGCISSLSWCCRNKNGFVRWAKKMLLFHNECRATGISKMIWEWRFRNVKHLTVGHNAYASMEPFSNDKNKFKMISAFWVLTFKWW